MCIANLIKWARETQPDTLDTITAIVQRMANGLTDEQMCELWYKIDQMAFNELGEIYTDTFTLSANETTALIKAQYPTITDLKMPDGTYTITKEAQLAQVLKRDWTYRAKYTAEIFDCDDFADLLKVHLALYYKLSSFTVWGDSTGGYHAYDLVIAKQDDLSNQAKLIEPQSGVIFITEGPCGVYTPRELINNYGEFKKEAK